MALNKSDLVSAIAEKAGLSKVDAGAAVDALQAVLVESLEQGEAVKVTGLLSVERVERAARTGRNPRTGEEISIPAGYGVKVSAGSVLKKAVQK
ncbi:DNA-binding protein HU-beta [Sediminihabitans luteus]|uniref:DNA-binding protein HU-beta n=1 Tax=Sediminihabitans luteus TaxID=1138585 RepID=A0A2M9D0T2_9CELL|nr:HU family DNA-binding protein [Sediminihabitans luteus]PJJ77779.1 DNA-binding protein HU-beta [Sediminihabitans luteus]GII99863.1 DNA-binding protein HB1 [Sediminihabitans luteus]